MNRKLVVRLKGGLGNQLFCYATARRLALQNNAELVLDDYTGFLYDHMYQRRFGLEQFSVEARRATPREMFEPLPRVRRFLLHKWSQHQPWQMRRYIKQIGVDFDERLLSLELRSGTSWFDGFGQSERYFADVEDVIRADLIIKPPTDDANTSMAQQIKTCDAAVALHVRWFEAGDSIVNVSSQYFANAIQRIAGLVAQPHFFVFSDNAAATRQKLDGMMSGYDKTFVQINKSEQMAYADMWLMSQCKHFIISNSTFSWWSAWLGEKKGHTEVIAPALVLPAFGNVTAWGFDGQIPERWTKL